MRAAWLSGIPLIYPPCDTSIRVRGMSVCGIAYLSWGDARSGIESGFPDKVTRSEVQPRRTP